MKAQKIPWPLAIDNGQGIAYTECTEGAANKRLAPYYNYLKRSNRWFGKAGRLLLFIRLNEQLANADDNKAKLENFGCTHLGTPLSSRIRGQEAPLTVRGKPLVAYRQRHRQDTTSLDKRQLSSSSKKRSEQAQSVFYTVIQIMPASNPHPGGTFSAARRARRRPPG